MANYSTDTDLKAYEPSILRHLPNTTPTTTSFDVQHTESKRIIDELMMSRLPEELKDYVDNGQMTINDLVDENDLKTVSVFHSLFLIFNWLSTRDDDVFSIKRERYRELYEEHLAGLAVDISVDGDADFEDELTLEGIQLFRS